jgi:hypothetical protein
MRRFYGVNKGELVNVIGAITAAAFRNSRAVESIQRQGRCRLVWR